MISGPKVNHFYNQNDGETEQFEMNDLSPLNPPEIVLPALLTLPLVNKEAEKNNWSAYAKVILPHIGLVLLCVLYTIAGATIFYLIEKDNEIKVRDRGVAEIRTLKTNILAEIWELSQNRTVSESNFSSAASDRIDDLTRLLFDAFEDRYITIDAIQDANHTRTQWTFPAAVFFAATTITTIGYGNLVPVTLEGRMLCVFFGLFGVPLMLVTIADLGKFISDGIVWLYVKYLKLKRKVRRKAKLREDRRQSELIDLADTDDTEIPIPVSLILIIIVGYTSLGGLLLQTWERWTFFHAFYFSFITMTTIGFGDFVPIQESYYILTLLYIILGLAITTMCVDLVGSQYIKKIHNFGRKIRSARDALRTMGDAMRYAAFLRKKYGLTDEQLKQMSILPDQTEWQDYINHCRAFIPKDIHRIYYIDQRTESILDSYRESLRDGSRLDDNSLNSVKVHSALKD